MTGQYSHTIDAKGRLFIPAKLREELGDTFYVAIGMDRCLSVYSDKSWDSFMEKLAAQPYSRTKELRPLLANAVRCEPDGQGRILLPAKLRQYAELSRDVVIIGSFDRAEIWNADKWAALENEALSSGELETAMEELGI